MDLLLVIERNESVNFYHQLITWASSTTKQHQEKKILTFQMAVGNQ